MIRSFVFFVFLIVGASIYAEDIEITPQCIYGKYGLPCIRSVEYMKKNFIGKRFVFNPGKRGSFYLEDLELGEQDKGKTIQFSKFSANDDGDPDMDLIVSFFVTEDLVEKKKKTVYMYKRGVSIFNLPFVDMTKIKDEIDEAKGKSFTLPDIKNTYTIVDAKFEYFTEKSDFESICYYIKDDISGDTIKYSNMDKDYKDFGNLISNKSHVIKMESVDVASKESDVSYDITSEKDGEYFYYTFSDSLISASIALIPKTFLISLKNLSNSTIKVIWDDAVIVDINGESNSVIHAGTRYAERDNTQIPTNIIKGAKISDTVSPKSKVKWVKGRRPQFYYFPFAVNTGFLGSILHSIAVSADINNSSPGYWEPFHTQLMLPIQMKDAIYEYIFNFVIDYQYSFQLNVLK